MTDYILNIVDLPLWNREIAVTTKDAVFLYSLFVGALSMFLQETYQKPMILRWYYILIKITFLKSQRNWVKSLMKPLGVCVYCQNFWINTILFPVFFGLSPYYILTIGGTYLSVELIRLIKKHA